MRAERKMGSKGSGERAKIKHVVEGRRTGARDGATLWSAAIDGDGGGTVDPGQDPR